MEGVYLKYHMKRILVGISGASGAPIAIRLLQRLNENQDVETHLIMSDSACLTIEQETEYSVQQVQSLADVVYDIKKIGARPASGSFQIDEMIIVPCSMKTVAGIAGGYSDNLLLRSADVMLKEGRPLFVVARESPLSPIHLRNLQELSMIGVRIIPPMVSYYQGYKTIGEWTNNFVERLLDKMEIRNNVKAWDGM